MKTDSIKTKEIDPAKDWILNSGIQSETEKRKGGFNSWFDLDKANYSYVYSEITGYGITTLLYLLDRFTDADYLEKAKDACEWLTAGALHKCGGVKTRDYYYDMHESDHYSFHSHNIYAFDNGMVLYGVVNLYKRTKDIKVLEIARSVADFLVENMRKPDGLFFAVYNAGTGEKEDSPRKWSSQSGSYHAKLAMGFIDLFDVTKDVRYKDTAIKLCEKSLAFQDSSGRFITSRADNSTHLHPHSYSAEGLLYAGLYFDRDDFVDSALRATKWALNSQQADGGVYKKFDGKKFIPYYRSDTLAQVLRLGLILSGIGKLDNSYVSKLEKLHDKLLEFQYKSENSQNGGFLYGRTLDGTQINHLNSWCTMFALQALVMYEEFIDSKAGINNMECFV